MLCLRAPELTPLVTESLFPFTNVSPFPSLSGPWQPPFNAVSMHLTFLDSACEIVRYSPFYVWFTSLSIMPTKFLHAVTAGRISLICRAGWYSIVCILYIHMVFMCIYVYMCILHVICMCTFSVSIHPSADSGCFHVLAIVNNAAVSMRCRCTFETLISLSSYIIPRSGVAGII